MSTLRARRPAELTDSDSTLIVGARTSVPVSDVLAALSRALDLTEGQPLGHSVRSCVIGMRLGEAAGLDEEAMAALYYALLLKDAGCSSNAARMAAVFGSDEQTVKPRLKTVDWDNRMRLAAETWRNTGLTQSLWTRMGYFLGIAREENLTRDLIAARCERGADIARRLGFPAATSDAIRSLDEHWNGNGYPEKLRGDAIPVLSRILNIAQTVEVFLGQGGANAVDGILVERRGRWFDPALTDRARELLRDDEFRRSVRSPDVEQEVLTLEPGRRAREVDEAGLDQIAEAFADIIDAKSPYTYRHSSQVANYASAVAERLGFDAIMRQTTRRAGLLHDIGKLGISSRILDKNGPLDQTERAAMEQHPLYTWNILSRVAAFEDFARAASNHHEKLDGSGYPWRLRDEELDPISRVLVVSDIYEAVTASRPYRDGLSIDQAIEVLGYGRGTKLDEDAVDALASFVTEAHAPSEL